jgi:hypothetical protein
MVDVVTYSEYVGDPAVQRADHRLDCVPHPAGERLEHGRNDQVQQVRHALGDIDHVEVDVQRIDIYGVGGRGARVQGDHRRCVHGGRADQPSAEVDGHVARNAREYRQTGDRHVASAGEARDQTEAGRIHGRNGDTEIYLELIPVYVD